MSVDRRLPDEFVNVRYMASRRGAQQILLEDPCGKPVERFQPAGS